MNPVRIIYEDTPDFIPIPEAFRHRRTEIIIWPLDEDPASVSSDSRTNQGQRQPGAWSHLPPPAADWEENQ